MSIAKVIDTDVNVRLFKPELNATERSWSLKIDEVVNPVKAVHGESHRGNDVWYLLESEKTYIWSGCVEFMNGSQPPVPVNKKVLITADDYGAIPSINEGIKAGVHKGIINSVAAFGNAGPDGEISQQMIKELRAVKNGDSIEIGVHLTMSSGNPITYKKGGSLLICNMRRKDRPFEESMFRSSELLKSWFNTGYKFYNETKKKRYQAELESEWRKQIESVEKGSGKDIAFLTSHCNVHLWHKDFTKIFTDLAIEFEVPVRSFHNFPEWKDNWYFRLVGKNFFPKNELKLMKKGICSSDKTSAPGFLNSQHFGPLPGINIGASDTFLSWVDKKQGILNGMFNELRWGEYDSMEIMLHLRGGQPEEEQDAFEKELYFINKDGAKVLYDGVDFRSFDARTAECHSILFGFPKWEKGISKGTWAELNGEDACRVEF